ncbi:helix-turn-helix transcriptional regulator [Streptomyces ortus]|uniref:Response regulator transcription factor n=1 Tax=Streptomyces ortus TaxID=2867268 RepID=A0ABT3UUW9_9ACTN|nr:response regulator transcription factor [Streptomyces ortus]MCX4231382.1 response regulator transcription factor [Streptomyces ortus]
MPQQVQQSEQVQQAQQAQKAQQVRQGRTETVRVAIHAPEPLVRAGLAGFAALDPCLHELPGDRIGEADAIVVAMEVADASVLDLLPRLSDGPDARFLVVVGKQWRADLTAARKRGVRGVVWWDFCSPAVFARSVRAVAGSDGSAPTPPHGPASTSASTSTSASALGVSHTEHTGGHLPSGATTATATAGATATATTRARTVPELSSREVDVLRLIAEGKQCDEIAVELSYSERTVRYILYGAMKRTRTRNRAHAVSYAIRAGLI